MSSSVNEWYCPRGECSGRSCESESYIHAPFTTMTMMRMMMMVRMMMVGRRRRAMIMLGTMTMVMILMSSSKCAPRSNSRCIARSYLNWVPQAHLRWWFRAMLVNLQAVCDDTQNLNETESETFFDTKFFRYRIRYFFRYQIFSIPNPKPPKNGKVSKLRSFETEMSHSASI